MARRTTPTFTMSFLDVISCGFGAVVLFYTIISAQAGLYRIKESSALTAEAKKLEQEVLDGYKHLAELQNALEATEDKTVRAAGLSREMLEKLKLTEEELSRYEHDTLARRESLERLKADLKSLEEDTRRLKAAAERVQTGTQVRSVAGDGDRQYLTGLKVGGKNVLILLDASASMLDETLVNIIRMRNMSPDRKLRSEKWQQAIGTVDWVSAQPAGRVAVPDLRIQHPRLVFVEYLWPKPNFKDPVPKISYVQGFAPWGWIIGSGIYIDDVRAVLMTEAAKYIVITAVIMSLILLVSMKIMKNTIRALNEAVRVSNSLAE